MIDMTDGEGRFIQIIATSIAPHLFVSGGERGDAAKACARLSGSIVAEMVESGALQVKDFPAVLEALSVLMVDEFDKYITGGGASVN